MRQPLRTTIALASALAIAASSEAEVLVRWTQVRVPSPQVLGVPALLVPVASRDAVREALTQGYRVYVEVPVAATATFTPPGPGLFGVVVRGKVTRVQLDTLKQRLGSRDVRVMSADERGTWPRIRANWVVKDNEILQIAGRSAQPWIDTNAALIRVAQAAGPDRAPLLVHDWTPATAADSDEGPALEDYLVAIAEAGSFGADVVLPLHDAFQRQLLLGEPDARRDWADVRRHIEFYQGDLPRHYTPIASMGVITSRPAAWLEVLTLLARHNLSFELIAPAQLASRSGPRLRLLAVLDRLDAAQAKTVAELERQGSVVKAVTEVPDPNRFALEMRQALGRDHRIVDIWNGITVLAAPYKAPERENVLLTLVNYAHRSLPVQLRVRGAFARVHYESPDEVAVLLPHESRDGFTEVVVPSLRVGGRLFFSR